MSGLDCDYIIVVKTQEDYFKNGAGSFILIVHTIGRQLTNSTENELMRFDCCMPTIRTEPQVIVRWRDLNQLKTGPAGSAYIGICA